MTWRLHQCPHCKTGDLHLEKERWGDVWTCFQCSYQVTKDTIPITGILKKRERIEQDCLVEKKSHEAKPQRSGMPFPGHYKKVKEKQEAVITMVSSGISIRKICCDTGLAKNTVRKIIREMRAGERLVAGG